MQKMSQHKEINPLESEQKVAEMNVSAVIGFRFQGFFKIIKNQNVTAD